MHFNEYKLKVEYNKYYNTIKQEFLKKLKAQNVTLKSEAVDLNVSRIIHILCIGRYGEEWNSQI